MKKQLTLFVISSLLLLSACAGSDGPSKGTITLHFEMPTSLESLTSTNNNLVVTGSVNVDPSSELATKIKEPEISTAQTASLTIKGDYKLGVLGLKAGESYTLKTSLAYKATSYVAPSLSAKIKKQQAATTNRVWITTDTSLCPTLSLTPDTSLTTDLDGEQVLSLCTTEFVFTYEPNGTFTIPSSAFTCNSDADGDGTANLDEISLSLDPYNGDYDGDCVDDTTDLFPTDATESKDTDGDGIGNNLDTDTDGDGLLNSEEVTLGTDPLKADTDSDGHLDGADLCPLKLNKGNQLDTDGDGSADVCDDDDDNDGLLDTTEIKNGTTDPLLWDSDDDGISDGDEYDSDGDGISDNLDAFPNDPTESVDADGDKIGDNHDSCVMVADGTADPCSPDDDNDGLADTLELRIGSNPNKSDSDNDGKKDWYGSTPKPLDADGCLLIKEENMHDMSDNDQDGFNADCDCNDNLSTTNPAASDDLDDNGTDSNCDKVDGKTYELVFVATDGSNTANGTLDHPVATLQKATELAQAQNKNVAIAAGTYTQITPFKPVAGIKYYGGYSATFTSRDPINSASIITGTLSPVVQLDSATAPYSFDGLIIDSQAETSATALLAESATVSINHTQIILSHTINISTGITITDTGGTIKNSSIKISSGSLRVGIACVSAGEESLTLDQLTFTLWSATDFTQNESTIYVQDCNIDGERNHYAVPVDDLVTWDGFSGSNIILGTY